MQATIADRVQKYIKSDREDLQDRLESAVQSFVFCFQQNCSSDERYDAIFTLYRRFDAIEDRNVNICQGITRRIETIYKIIKSSSAKIISDVECRNQFCKSILEVLE